MGVKSRGLLSLRTNLFLFFTNGGHEHQTAQILRHAVSNHAIRTPYRDDRIQARRVQASGHPLRYCVAKSEQSKKTPRKFSKSRFPLASRYLFLSKPLREYNLVDSLLSLACCLDWICFSHCSVTGGLNYPIERRNPHTFSPTKTISGLRRVAPPRLGLLDRAHIM